MPVSPFDGLIFSGASELREDGTVGQELYAQVLSASWRTKLVNNKTHDAASLETKRVKHSARGR